MKLPPFRKNLIQYIGGSIALMAVLYFAFVALNETGLSQQVAEAAPIQAKAYRPAVHGTRMVKSGNSFHSVPSYTPEAWVITVGIEGESGYGTVPRSDYDRMQIGEKVQAVYSRKRISRTLVVRALFKND